MSEVKNFEMNLRRALNKKQQPKESQVKKAAEAMFGPIGKRKKNLKQRLLILNTRKKLMRRYYEI